MDEIIFVGIAVVFGQMCLMVLTFLTVFKLLHWVFKYDNRNWKRDFRLHNGIE